VAKSVLIKTRQAAGFAPLPLSVGARAKSAGPAPTSGELVFTPAGKLVSNSIVELLLPADIDQLVAVVPEATSNVVNLPATNPVRICVEVNQRPSNDLKWALGGTRDSRVTGIVMAVEPISTDPCALNDLVEAIDAPTAEERTSSVQKVLDGYRDRPEAVARILLLLEPEQYDRLSGNGRVNAFVLLNTLELNSWTPQLASKARTALASLRERASTGEIRIGPRVADGMDRLEQRLGQVGN